MPNELNNRVDRYIFSLRDNYTLFVHTIKRIHLVKMRLPFDGVNNAYLRISSFGDNLEFAFFGALTSVGALFVFTEKYLYFKEKRNGRKNYCTWI